MYGSEGCEILIKRLNNVNFSDSKICKRGCYILKHTMLELPVKAELNWKILLSPKLISPIISLHYHQNGSWMNLGYYFEVKCVNIGINIK